MLSEEEKQAIEYVKSLVDLFDKGFPLNYLEEENDTLKILLNLINKLKKENEVLKQAYDRETADRSNDLLELQKKDKQIELMAEYMFNKNRAQLIIEYGIENKEQLIKEFKELSKEKGE